MGVTFGIRPRLERIPLTDPYEVHAQGVAGNGQVQSDPEPVIRAAWEKAEAVRTEQLEALDRRLLGS